MKIALVLFGLILVLIGLIGIYRGVVPGVGPLGVGSTIYYSERPVRFCAEIIFYLAFGGYVIYRVLTKKIE